MSKNIIVGLVIIAVVLGGYLYNNNSKVMDQQDTIVKTEQYLPYTKDILESSKDTRRVLFFYASWCPTCRPADAGFSASSSQIPEDVVVIRVNYNDPDTDSEEKALAAKYGVTYQHTFIQIDESGEVVTKWNGGGLTELLANLQS